MNATKIIHCDKYGVKSRFIEVDIYPYFEQKKKRKKNKVQRETCATQANLNDKRARRYFGQLAKSNFTNNDYHIVLTYAEEVSQEEADKALETYIRKTNRRRKSKGLKNAKYMAVTETQKNGNIHHHIIISGGLSRDEMEAMWTKQRIAWSKWEKDEKYRESIKQIGWANCDRLQFNKKGIDELCGYLCKDPKGRKRWRSSKNLIKPWFRNPKIGGISNNKLSRLCTMPTDCEEFRNYFEKKFKGYDLDEAVTEWNKVTARWSLYLKLHLIN